jgi:hypothetical protein
MFRICSFKTPSGCTDWSTTRTCLFTRGAGPGGRGSLSTGRARRETGRNSGGSPRAADLPGDNGRGGRILPICRRAGRGIAEAPSAGWLAVRGNFCGKEESDVRTLGGHGISELPPHLNAASSERSPFRSSAQSTRSVRLEEGQVGKYWASPDEHLRRVDYREFCKGGRIRCAKQHPKAKRPTY